MASDTLLLDDLLCDDVGCAKEKRRGCALRSERTALEDGTGNERCLVSLLSL